MYYSAYCNICTFVAVDYAANIKTKLLFKVTKEKLAKYNAVHLSTHFS
jgi:hypothetical protein